MVIAREPQWVKTDMQKYRNLLEKVRYLRTKGWVIYMKGNGMFLVGTKEMDDDGLVELWSREKRRDGSDIGNAHKAMGSSGQEGEEETG